MVACTAANTGDRSPAPRQDGINGRDAAATAGVLTKVGGGGAGFDFTALDANGQPTTPSSGTTPHPCVRDNVTGLTWEVKTDDGGLHDRDWSYTWYNSDPNTNGGIGPGDNGTAGTTPICNNSLNGANCNTEELVKAVNTAGWCGYTDWRMPTLRDLLSLVHYGAGEISSSPPIDTTYFPDVTESMFTGFSFYWTAQRCDIDLAWYVSFSSTLRSNMCSGTVELRSVRLVRGEQF